MSKRKGLSIDEKRTKMLQIFHEDQNVFQLKDIEKLAPTKGITLQSVKGVLEELVNDGLVDSDKIGSSLYYWSFPAKKRNDLKRKKDDLLKKNADLDTKILALEQSIELEKEKCKSNEKNSEKAVKVEKLKLYEIQLKNELEMCLKNDSGLAKTKSDEIKRIIEAANRWTDNIFSLKTWCKNKFGMFDKDLDKHFEIPEDFDYLPES